jgi:flagellar basal-body rod protein FlgC
MYGLLDISASGLVAQRTRLDVATANLVNRHTLAGTDGEYDPYRRRMAIVAAGDPDRGSEFGVHISAIDKNDGPLTPKYEPTSEYANADGYVYYPDIDPATEMINALEAIRAYQANTMAAEATKSMVSMAMRLLA